MKVRNSINKLLKGSLSLSLAYMSLGINMTAQAAGGVQTNITNSSIKIENDYIGREYNIQDGHVLTKELANKRANTTLTPQEGSEDFMIHLVSHDEKPTPKPEIHNDPVYIVNGVDQRIDTAAWTATLQNAGGQSFSESEVNKLFDNNPDTFVDNYQINGNPFTLSIDMGSAQSISSMSVQKRPGYTDETYGINGTMGGYKISVKVNETDEWQEIKTGEFTDKDYNLHTVGNLYNVGDMVFVNFDPVNARYIKVEQTSNAIGTPQEFSSSEIGFYSGTLERVQKVVPPVQALNRTAWNVSIKNSSQAAFSEAQTNKLIDGDLNTNPDEPSKAGNPFTVDIDLGSKQKVSSLSIDKRPGFTDANYGVNGTLGKFELYVSEDGTNWEIAGAGNFTKEAYNLHDSEDGTLHNVGDRVYANFLKTYDTRYVRLVQKSCSLGGTEEFTSAELNLYSDPYVGYNWNTDIQKQPSASEILSSQLTYKGAQESTIDGGKKLTISYEPYEAEGVTYTIDQVVVLKNEDHFARSFIEISVSDPALAQIDYIDQDHFVLPDDATGVWSHPEDSKISSQWIGKHELMLGQPIYANGFFMGSEFPAADTIIKNNETQIRYYSGKTFDRLKQDGQLTKDNKFVSWQNVVGAARGTDTSVVQTDFFDYIEQIATPTEFRKQYNSWYDNMMNITDESIASSFNGAEAGLTSNGVEPMDSYVVDDGWNNYYDGTYLTTPGSSQGTTKNQTGFWEFNDKFPNELYTSTALADKLQSSFGLWLGPQGGYNYFSQFADFLEASGTGYAQNDFWKNVCVGSDRYVKNLEKLFIDYQSRFNIDYWKWDGFAVRPCTNPEHDHMTGGTQNMYYTSDLWEKWIDVFESVRAARAKEGKGLFINATCYVNLSPWLLQWVNTIWVQDSGDTGESGTGARHQQKITYRDQVYYNLYKKNQIQFPLKNIYNHDPIYGVSDGSNATTDVFREYLMANAVRGTAFWELYYSPSLFDDAKWKVNADVLDFAEKNHNILKNAKLFGNEPTKGVYGYSSWNGNEGIISFTNPLDSEQTYQLTVDEKVGAVQTLNNATGIQVEPYVAGVMLQKLSYGDTLSVTLKPHETKIFQYNEQDNTAPKLVSAKVTGKREVTLKFSERVATDDVYQVNGAAASFELKEDYRTVVLSLDKDLKKDEKVHVAINGIKDTYNNTANLEADIVAYDAGVIAKAESSKDLKSAEGVKDVTQEATNTPFMKFSGTKQLNTANALTGTQDFSISMAVKTGSKDTTLFKQGNDVSLRIDENGYLVFKVKDLSVSSEETVTTVKEKAHGTFGTDQYVPTSTVNSVKGAVNDSDLHTVQAVREPNGMLKIYLDGVLAGSAYDEAKLNQSIAKAPIELGGKNFSGYLGDVKFVNAAVQYTDAQSAADKLNIGMKDTRLDRTGWTASACSQMEGPSGDSNAQAAIDGDLNTWWHTNYLGGDSDPVDAHWLEIDFGKEISFDNFIYRGRGGSNGDLKGYVLEAKIDGKWQTIKEGEFSRDIESTVPLGKTITASAIKLKSVSTQNGQNFAAAVEVYVSKNVEKPATNEELQQLRDEAKPIVEQDYTAASVAAYKTVVDKINKLDELNTTASDVEALRKQLKTAWDGLVSIKPLKTAITKAEKFAQENADVLESKYAADLNQAINAARALLLKADAGKSEVAEAGKKLTDLLDAPVYKEISKAELQKLITEAEQAVSHASDYTKESMDVLQTALKTAKEVASNDKATQQQVNDAAIKLSNAIQQLKKADKPGTPEKPEIPDKPTKPEKPQPDKPKPESSHQTLTSPDKFVEISGKLAKGTKLILNYIPADSMRDVIKDKDYLKKVTLENVFDLSLQADGKSIQPDGNVQVSLTLSDYLKDKKLDVIYIDPDGKIEIMDSTRVGDRLVFTTSHFLTYAIVSYEGERPIPNADINAGIQGNVNTSDSTNSKALFAVVLLCGGIAVLTYRKRRASR